MAILEYDEAAARQMIAAYLTPDVVSQRERFVRAFRPEIGERVLDVGSGPGFLAAQLADAVGPTGRVCGVEISEVLVKTAQSYCADKPWVEIRLGDAIQLPFPNDCFDAAVSTQVLEYVAAVDSAISELSRVVRHGGRVAILDTDWDSIVWRSSDRHRMNRILAAWEEHAAHPYLPRTLANRLRGAGLHVDSQEVIPLFNPNYEPDTYSNRIIDLIVPFVEARGGLTREESAAWARELRESGEKGEYFFSLNRYLFMATKP